MANSMQQSASRQLALPDTLTPSASPEDQGPRQLVVEGAEKKMRHVREIYDAGAEELSAVYQHVVFRLCATETTVAGLVRLKEVNGPVTGATATALARRRGAYLDSMTAAQGDAAKRIKQIADSYGAQEASFGAFVRSIIHGGVAVDGAPGLLAIGGVVTWFAGVALASTLVAALVAALYVDRVCQPHRLARSEIRDVGRQARQQVDMLSEQYIAEVRDGLA